MKLKNPSKLIACFLVILLLILLSVEIMLCALPPIARDALIHHLAIPKLWLNNGGFYEIKWADFSYFPMNVDLLYIIPLYFRRDFLANFIHMTFAIGTALLIYHYLYNKIGYIAGLLGMLIFLSTPIVVRLSTQAYVDLGLTFFTTASILFFIRYRDGKFKELKWLFLSSAAMGLALGTKYNALVVWFFLSLSIVFIYSRDTEKQWKAVLHGGIYFLISLIIFSPWLIKNIILTGNPLYPLFKGISFPIVSEDTHPGFFQMREILYGENFWETLLIPFRIFFEGQDNSSRYFDGVLNPVFIILSPFAFMNKSFHRDKLFFIFFTIFFILTVFFLEQKAFTINQIVRYIIPALPFLTILTVMGLINIWNWSANFSFSTRSILTTILFAMFFVIMNKNIFYIKSYYQNINPVNYLLGKESSDEFITRHNGSYPAIRYINKYTPKNAKIRLVFLAGRGYYLDRIYDEGDAYGIGDTRGLAANAGEEKSFRQYLDSLGCTHLLIRMDLFNKFLRDNYPQETIDRLLLLLDKETEIIYQANGFSIYRLITH